MLAPVAARNETTTDRFIQHDLFETGDHIGPSLQYRF